MLLKISADGQYTYDGYIIYKASLWYHIFTISSNGEIRSWWGPGKNEDILEIVEFR